MAWSGRTACKSRGRAVRSPLSSMSPDSGRLGSDWATSNRGSEADRVETTEDVQERLAGESRDVLFLAFRVLVSSIWRDGKL